MDYIQYGYIGLFLGCFIAATIIPLASEAILIGFLIAGFDPYISWIMASVGNTLGGVTNYILGSLGKVKSLEKYFKNKEKFTRIKNSIEKYGVWMGLLTWLPIIGDPLTIFLGFFRVKFIPLLFTMLFAKTVRYFVISLYWLL